MPPVAITVTFDRKVSTFPVSGLIERYARSKRLECVASRFYPNDAGLAISNGEEILKHVDVGVTFEGAHETLLDFAPVLSAGQ